MDDMIINKKGFIIVLVMAIAVVIALTIAAIMPQSIREINMAEGMANSIRAFYAAESGINRVIFGINNYDTDTEWITAGWSITEAEPYTDTNGNGRYDEGETYTDTNVNGQYDGKRYAYSETLNGEGYQVVLNMYMAGSDNPVAISTGYSPDTSGTNRYIWAELTMPLKAIAATGTISVGGTANVESFESGASFTFDEIFGMSKIAMKALETTTIVVDPANNYSPVSDITWFVLVDNAQVMFTATTWTGSGIMVVEGNLTINGGTFNGIIWVSGNVTLNVAGNAVINGAVFVEGTANIAGTPTLNYSQSSVNGALGLVGASTEEPMPYWTEFYP